MTVGESVEVGYGARLQELVRDLNLTRHVSMKNFMEVLLFKDKVKMD